MIHFTKEGYYKKIGLNLYRAKGGFVIGWIWYDIATRELWGWRFRLRMHMKPRIIWSVEKSNVIDSYLFAHDLELVQRAILQDLKIGEATDMRRSDRQAYVNRMDLSTGAGHNSGNHSPEVSHG